MMTRKEQLTVWTNAYNAALTGLLSVRGHFKPASNGRNDPATIIGVSRHFSFKQTRRNSLLSGLFERKMPLFSKCLTQNELAGSFRPFVAGLISTDDSPSVPAILAEAL
jgi:hypothetical protein